MIFELLYKWQQWYINRRPTTVTRDFQKVSLLPCITSSNIFNPHVGTRSKKQSALSQIKTTCIAYQDCTELLNKCVTDHKLLRSPSKHSTSTLHSYPSNQSKLNAFKASLVLVSWLKQEFHTAVKCLRRKVTWKNIYYLWSGNLATSAVHFILEWG